MAFWKSLPFVSCKIVCRNKYHLLKEYLVELDDSRLASRSPGIWQRRNGHQGGSINMTDPPNPIKETWEIIIFQRKNGIYLHDWTLCLMFWSKFYPLFQIISEEKMNGKVKHEALWSLLSGLNPVWHLDPSSIIFSKLLILQIHQTASARKQTKPETPMWTRVGLSLSDLSLFEKEEILMKLW